ncbi:MAG: glycosyltransferase family 4 protein [Pseudomonadota bacterium]
MQINSPPPSSPPSILAMVTEAFGGKGGIAQYNRDLFEAISQGDDQWQINIVPRLCPDQQPDTLANITQAAATPGRLSYARAVLAAALKEKPDVVFCGHLYTAPLAALAATIAQSKLVIQLHGIEIWEPPTALQRRALETADLVLCVSRDTRARVLSWTNLAPHKVRVLSNTVSEKFSPGDQQAARARFGWSRTQFVMLAVGRLDSRERYKGQDKIINALPKLVRTHPNLLFAISGEGDDQPRLEALARNVGVEHAVCFLGHVPANMIVDLYRAADLFALPSTGEGFGIVFLEAMACGTSALGLATAGARDALGDGHLGIATTEEMLPSAIDEAVKAPKNDPHMLAQAVQDRYGRSAFMKHAQALLKTLTTPSSPNDKKWYVG